MASDLRPRAPKHLPRSPASSAAAVNVGPAIASASSFDSGAGPGCSGPWVRPDLASRCGHLAATDRTSHPARFPGKRPRVAPKAPARASGSLTTGLPYPVTVHSAQTTALPYRALHSAPRRSYGPRVLSAPPSGDVLRSRCVCRRQRSRAPGCVTSLNGAGLAGATRLPGVAGRHGVAAPLRCAPPPTLRALGAVAEFAENERGTGSEGRSGPGHASVAVAARTVT